MKFKASQVKRVSKTRPIGTSWMIQGKNPRTKKGHKMQRSRSVGTATARGHHGLPVVFTTACGGCGMAVLSGTHGRASPYATDLRFSFAAFRLPARFFDLS